LAGARGKFFLGPNKKFLGGNLPPPPAPLLAALILYKALIVKYHYTNNIFGDLRQWVVKPVKKLIYLINHEEGTKEITSICGDGFCICVDFLGLVNVDFQNYFVNEFTSYS
jgi:hypothetical protein